MNVSDVLTAPSDALVLVVDDDEASLRLSEQILAAAGYGNVRLYTSAGEALSCPDLDRIDLVISDIHMPGIDGLHLLEVIRERGPSHSFLPVLMITADVTPETRRKALRLGASDFLTKPLDVVEMTLRIGHLIRLRAMHTELEWSRHRLEDEVRERTAELELAMERLENLVQAKDVFIASVSHELRTPLTAILGFASELAAHSTDARQEEVSGMAEVIAAQATDLAAIIDDLLVAARSDIDAVEVFDEPVDLAAEAGAVVGALRAGDRERVRLGPATVTVRADHLRVRQILRNLVTNALRHGGPMVSVEFGEGEGVGTVTVIDDGPGVPVEERELLFEPYVHRGDDRGQPASIGLGLTVSRFLARLMSGSLKIVDDPRGTAFRLALPARR